MNNQRAEFDPYDNAPPGDYHPAQSRLFHQLRLRNEFEEDWSVINRDASRAQEFADFYFAHPEMRGCERALCADLVVQSAIDFIDPESPGEDEPASEQVAEAMMRRLVNDRHTHYYLESCVRPELRARGWYKRMALLYDRVVPR